TVAPAVIYFDVGGRESLGRSTCRPGVALSRKGAKSDTRGRKLRSTGTKARARVGQVRKPPADLEQQFESYREELAEAREQQAATSEILGIVARSPTDVRSVLDGICQSAARLCDAYDSAIWVPDGDRLALAAHHGQITAPKSLPLVRETVAG